MTQSCNRTEGMESLNRSGDLDKFHKLLRRAAESKRKDIVDRHGNKGCTKLLARGLHERKKERPEFKKKNYESTILDALEDWEISPKTSPRSSPRMSPRTSPRSNSERDESTGKTIKNAWVWNLSETADAGKVSKSRRRRGGLEV